MSVEVTFSGGMHIVLAAERLCAAAKISGEATGDFNGIRLRADRAAVPAQVVMAYDLQVEEAHRAWRESPEGIAAARRAVLDRVEKQAAHDALMKRLPSLDWSDQAAVLDWLCAMQPPSDRIGVVVDEATILDAFAARGLRPRMDLGREYQAGVKESEWRWMVGQALDGIARGPAIHSILHKFATEWKARWGSGT